MRLFFLLIVGVALVFPCDPPKTDSCTSCELRQISSADSTCSGLSADSPIVEFGTNAAGCTTVRFTGCALFAFGVINFNGNQCVTLTEPGAPITCVNGSFVNDDSTYNTIEYFVKDGCSSFG